MNAKKRMLFAAICSTFLFLNGCWDRTEINDLAIITLITIDKAEEEHLIELSAQIYLPKPFTGTEKGGTSEANVTNVSGIGINIADALSKLQAKLPRKAFWGHCKVFIFGEEIARAGIREHMDFLLRHPQIREQAYIYVSEKKAKQFLKSKPKLERFTGEILREVSTQGIGMEITLQELDEMMIGSSQAAALPYIVVGKEPGTGGEEKDLNLFPRIMGTAVFLKGKMVGKLNESETRGILWIRDEITEYTSTVHSPDFKEHISVFPLSSRATLIPQIDKDKWKMRLKIYTEGIIIQNMSKLDLNKTEVFPKIEQALAKDIKERMETSLKRVQKDMQADIVGFAEEFRREYPDEWKKAEENWQEKFPQVEVILDVEVRIRRNGYISNENQAEINEREREKQ